MTFTDDDLRALQQLFFSSPATGDTFQDKLAALFRYAMKSPEVQALDRRLWAQAQIDTTSTVLQNVDKHASDQKQSLQRDIDALTVLRDTFSVVTATASDATATPAQKE